MTPQNKNVTYLNKDFNDFKNSLSNYAKTYFPNTYNDFSETSVGNMFIEMSAYVGDVLSFYLDNQFQENLFLYTKEKENIMAMAYTLGYIPKNSYASTTVTDIYQLLPITSSGGIASPDYRYALVFNENTVLKSSSTNYTFLTTDVVDFSDTGSIELSLLNDTYFLAKKSVNAISAEVKSTTFTFGTPIKFNSVTISDTNILQILNVTGSDGSVWYEVPYLAQDIIIDKTSNSSANSDQVPYVLSLKKVPKRFTSRFQSDGSLKIEFGAGISSQSDTSIIPTPDNVQLGLIPSVSNLLNNYNKASVYYTKEYGTAPSNISLTFNYLAGGGIVSNLPSNDITQLTSLNTVSFKQSVPDATVGNIILNTNNITVNNPVPSTGGRDGDTVDEIRLNTLYTFSAQNRTVTKDDYMTRALSMPSIFGSIAKAYVVQDSLISLQSENDSLIDNNPLALSIYVLGYNASKKLMTASSTLKNNLKTYLNQYRIITDALTIKNAYYINIGINFDITTLSGYNNNEVISNCIITLQNYFNINNWQINQPISISEVSSTLLKINGVQSIIKLEFTNKQSSDDTYSQYGYDLSGATRNNIIYPSIDPSIFEVRYPNTDILGRVVYI
jgi:hypothetical protein